MKLARSPCEAGDNGRQRADCVLGFGKAHHPARWALDSKPARPGLRGHTLRTSLGLSANRGKTAAAANAFYSRAHFRNFIVARWNQDRVLARSLRVLFSRNR